MCVCDVVDIVPTSGMRERESEREWTQRKSDGDSSSVCTSAFDTYTPFMFSAVRSLGYVVGFLC